MILTCVAGSSLIGKRLKIVVHGVFSIVSKLLMAAWRTTAARLGRFKTDRDLPVAERHPFPVDQFFPRARVGLVAESAGPSFADIGHMDEVQIEIPVAEIGVEGRIRVTQQILFVTTEAEVISSLPVRSIAPFGVIAFQQTIIVRTMGIMTVPALPFANRPVQVFLAGNLLLDIFQLRIRPMTGQTEVLLRNRQQTMFLGKMGGVAVGTTPLLRHRPVFDLGRCRPLADVRMTAETELGHLLLEAEAVIRGVRVMTIGAERILHRRVNDGGSRHLGGKIIVTAKTAVANRLFHQRLVVRRMRAMTAVAGPDRNRSMTEGPGKGGLVVTLEAER